VTSEIQQNRYDRLLRRVAGIIGPGSKVSEVLTELFPVLDVETVPSELLILAGTNICMGGGVLAAAAGESPKMGVFNPANSNTIITITGFVVSTPSGNATARWGRNVTELGTIINTEIFTDTRNEINQRPVGRVAQESAVALANATGQTRILSNTPFTAKFPNDLMVLRPAIGFELGLQSTQGTIHTTFYWRERPMEASEVLGSG